MKDRIIKIPNENVAKLTKIFSCTERAVYKALAFTSDSPLSKKIRYTAMKSCDGSLWEKTDKTARDVALIDKQK